MPFGLKVAPGTSQRSVEIVLTKVKWLLPIVHIDDIVIFCRMPEELIVNVRQLFTLLQDAGVRLTLKMQSFTSRIDFLRHGISPGSLEVST